MIEYQVLPKLFGLWVQLVPHPRHILLTFRVLQIKITGRLDEDPSPEEEIDGCLATPKTLHRPSPFAISSTVSVSRTNSATFSADCSWHLRNLGHDPNLESLNYYTTFIRVPNISISVMQVLRGPFRAELWKALPWLKGARIATY